jgi:hypothetical protein
MNLSDLVKQCAETEEWRYLRTANFFISSKARNLSLVLALIRLFRRAGKKISPSGRNEK